MAFRTNYTHPLYNTWSQLLQRCNNPKNPNYKYYGAKGIKVCDRWLGRQGFSNFIADMGERPKDTTLDRKDTSLSYSQSNCRWANSTVQRLNRKTSKRASGYQGVEAMRGHYRARTHYKGKLVHIGMFDSAIEAHEVYKLKVSQLIAVETI